MVEEVRGDSRAVERRAERMRDEEGGWWKEGGGRKGEA
jgi:hypothetical protein